MGEKRNHTILSEDGKNAYNSAYGITVSTGFQGAVPSTFPGKQPPTQAIEKPENTSGEIAYWGDDNKFPQTVIEECSKNPVVGSTLDWKARALYGAGMMYGRVTGFDSDGNEIFQRERIPEIEDFLKKSNIKRYLFEAAKDLYWFYNVFPEMMLSKDRTKIVALETKEAAHCRWKKQDEKGYIKKCYIKGNWAEKNTTIDDAAIVDVLDPYYDPVTALREASFYKFIYPLSYPSPDKVYYQLADWNSIRTSGWLDVTNKIPAFKKALFENQLTLKYHIEFFTWYWEWKFSNWKEFTDKEKKDKIREEVDNIVTVLAGELNAGKSITTHSIYDETSGREIPGIRITAIDNKIKDGIYVEDAQEGNAHLLFAMGVHGTLLGAGPGRNSMGAGSGSDQRVAFNNYISLCQYQHDLILEPLNFARDFNKWDSEIEFRFRKPMIMTLDKGKQTQQETA